MEWALRDYKTEGQIWDGVDGCDHDWNIHCDLDKSNHNSEGKSTICIERGGHYRATDRHFGQSNFCSKCNAWKGSLGLEPTFDLYIKHLCAIFDQVKRVLKKTGACWIVLGDTYNGAKTGYGRVGPNGMHRHQLELLHESMKDCKKERAGDIPDKSLCMIPERFAIEMINRGWILRNKIIWYKPNCMPSSAKDRFTVDWEYVFFLTKSNEIQYWTNSKTGKSTNKQPLGTKGIEGEDWEWKEDENGKYKKNLWQGHDYYFETQYEPSLDPEDDVRRLSKAKMYNKASRYFDDHQFHNRKTNEEMRQQAYLGRIKRTVWKISTKPFSGAHFAVFPPELVETPIKATCPEYVCTKCGKARHLEYDEIRGNHKGMPKFGGNKRSGETDERTFSAARTYSGKEWNPIIERSNPVMTDCGCGAPFKPGVCLDPFMGAGTTGLVALKLNRNFVGIELNRAYIDLAYDRLEPLMKQEKLI